MNDSTPVQPPAEKSANDYVEPKRRRVRHDKAPIPKPCDKCGAPKRSAKSKQCRTCWRAEQAVIAENRRPTAPPNNLATIDPKILDRQRRHFDLRVSGYTLTAISNATGSSIETVVSDIRAESIRRAWENAKERRETLDISLSRIDGIVQRTSLFIQQAREQSTERVPMLDGAGKPVLDANQQPRYTSKIVNIKLAHEATLAENVLMKANRQIDLLLGHLVPLPIGATAPAANVTSIVAILLDGMSDEERLRAMRNASERARELGVLPSGRRDSDIVVNPS